MNRFPIVGITHGDINGISYELMHKLLSEPEILELFTPVIFGSSRIANQTARALQQPHLPLNIVQHAHEAIAGRINWVEVCDKEIEAETGQATDTALKAEAAALDAALDAYANQDIDLIVAAPGRIHNGYQEMLLSEYLKQRLQTENNTYEWIQTPRVRSLNLHTANCTTSLGEGMANEQFCQQIEEIHNHLRRYQGFIRPCMAVVTDNERLTPPIKELQNKKIFAFGPFRKQDLDDNHSFHHFDAVIFVDQPEARRQLMETEDQVVGLLSGLPMLWAYTIQGPTYELAGTNQSDSSGLRHTLYFAIDMWRNTLAYDQATASPLIKQWVPRGRDDFKLDLTKEDED